MKKKILVVILLFSFIHFTGIFQTSNYDALTAASGGGGSGGGSSFSTDKSVKLTAEEIENHYLLKDQLDRIYDRTGEMQVKKTTSIDEADRMSIGEILFYYPEIADSVDRDKKKFIGLMLRKTDQNIAVITQNLDAEEANSKEVIRDLKLLGLNLRIIEWVLYL